MALLELWREYACDESAYLEIPFILLHFLILSTQGGKGNFRDAGGGVTAVVVSGFAKPKRNLIRLHSDSTCAKNASGSARLLALDTKTRSDIDGNLLLRNDFAFSIVFVAACTFAFNRVCDFRRRHNSFLLTDIVSSSS